MSVRKDTFAISQPVKNLLYLDIVSMRISPDAVEQRAKFAREYHPDLPAFIGDKPAMMVYPVIDAWKQLPELSMADDGHLFPCETTITLSRETCEAFIQRQPSNIEMTYNRAATRYLDKIDLAKVPELFEIRLRSFETGTPVNSCKTFAVADTFDALVLGVSYLCFGATSTEKSGSNRLYRYDNKHNRWSSNDTFASRDPSTIIGYEKVVNEIVGYGEQLMNINQQIAEFGETLSYNFLILGPPGSGKSSALRSIASKLGIPIYTVSMVDFKGDIHTVLNPADGNDQIDRSKPVMVILEDFDRFLASGAFKLGMSDILNAFDGVASQGGYLRFLVANDPNVVYAEEAVGSRVTKSFQFDYPTSESIIQQVKRIYAKRGFDEENIPKLKQCLAKQTENVSMRAITHALCLHYNHKTPVAAVIEHLKEVAIFNERYLKQLLESRAKEAIEKEDPYHARGLLYN